MQAHSLLDYYDIYDFVMISVWRTVKHLLYLEQYAYYYEHSDRVEHCVTVAKLQYVAQLIGIGCDKRNIHHALCYSFLGRICICRTQ
jgi:hypothetical protein